MAPRLGGERDQGDAREIFDEGWRAGPKTVIDG